MVVIEIENPATEPLSVAEAKAWCRIERSDEDALVAALIVAARETVERMTGLVLARRTVRVAVDQVGPDREIRVSRRPLAEVAAVVAYRTDGTADALGPETVAIDDLAGASVLRVSPEATQAAAWGLEVDVVAGFEAAMVPAALKLAMQQIVASSYELRGAVPPAFQPGSIPDAARGAIAAFREHRI